MAGTTVLMIVTALGKNPHVLQQRVVSLEECNAMATSVLNESHWKSERQRLSVECIPQGQHRPQYYGQGAPSFGLPAYGYGHHPHGHGFREGYQEGYQDGRQSVQPVPTPAPQPQQPKPQNQSKPFYGGMAPPVRQSPDQLRGGSESTR